MPKMEYDYCIICVNSFVSFRFIFFLRLALLFIRTHIHGPLYRIYLNEIFIIRNSHKNVIFTNEKWPRIQYFCGNNLTLSTCQYSGRWALLLRCSRLTHTLRSHSIRMYILLECSRKYEEIHTYIRSHIDVSRWTMNSMCACVQSAHIWK